MVKSQRVSELLTGRAVDCKKLDSFIGLFSPHTSVNTEESLSNRSVGTFVKEDQKQVKRLPRLIDWEPEE